LLQLWAGRTPPESHYPSKTKEFGPKSRGTGTALATPVSWTRPTKLIPRIAAGFLLLASGEAHALCGQGTTAFGYGGGCGDNLTDMAILHAATGAVAGATIAMTAINATHLRLGDRAGPDPLLGILSGVLGATVGAAILYLSPNYGGDSSREVRILGVISVGLSVRSFVTGVSAASKDAPRSLATRVANRYH